MTQLTIQAADAVSKQNISILVHSALQHERDLLHASLDRTRQRLGEFETKYSRSTDQFETEYRTGILGDSDDFIDWFGELQLLRVLAQKSSSLEDVVIC
jgi:hypothetical protein